MGFPKSAYGGNPHISINPNNNPIGWGNYQWPGGVPASLLHTERFSVGGTSGSLTMRRELFPLVQYCLRIAYELHGYKVYGYPNPGGDPTWGPWTYENRAIGGTSSPSNHSKGRAWDWNAPRNQQSYTFISDIPPKLVDAMESLGWYWGGRYVGSKYDAMHFEFVMPLGLVGPMTNLAAALLGGKPAPTPTPTPTPAPASSVKITVPGVTVTKLQHALGTIHVDGIAGPATLAAVKAYQAAHGLTVDGIVGPATWAILTTSQPEEDMPLTQDDINKIAAAVWNQMIPAEQGSNATAKQVARSTLLRSAEALAALSVVGKQVDAVGKRI